MNHLIWRPWPLTVNDYMAWSLDISLDILSQTHSSSINLDDYLLAEQKTVTVFSGYRLWCQKNLAVVCDDFHAQARKEAESWRGRLDDAQTELFKLEKALEIKVNHLRWHNTVYC